MFQRCPKCGGTVHLLTKMNMGDDSAHDGLCQKCFTPFYLRENAWTEDYTPYDWFEALHGKRAAVDAGEDADSGAHSAPQGAGRAE